MAKNDKILLDGIVDDRIESNLPSNQRDEAFEYFVFEQILKDFDLSRDEIIHGTVDGRDDGGIDGFFIFINGHLLSDTEDFVWPKIGSQIDAWIVTCKHHDTFKQSPLDNLAASLAELLDFSIQVNELKGSYSEEIRNCRENLKLAYRKLSPRLSSFCVNLAYASRGDTQDIGQSILARSNQIKNIVLDAFGKCDARFNFYGSTELVELYRKAPSFSLELPFIEALSKGERYLLLANLKDYFNFVTDAETGNLRRYLFDSNVRDFMGLNRVNEDIKSTLENQDSPDFWWLNNGVTILSTGASVTGKSIQIQDIQIVNGLQTTESIYRYFSCGGGDAVERSVLVKVIVTTDEVVRDSIIKATNNQTNVELAYLHATDKIQRDIEDILVRSGIFYERRKNYYANLGHASSEIVAPLYLAAGYVNLILKSPHQAASLRSRFLRSEQSYNSVFSPKMPLEVWSKIVIALKKVDEILITLRPTGRHGTERFLKKWRQITCFLAVSKIFGKFNFSAAEMAKFDESMLTKEVITEVWSLVSGTTTVYVSGNDWRKRSSVIALCKKAMKKYGIQGIESIEKRKLPLFSSRTVNPKITMDFALKVNNELPEQPWKPGIHQIITSKLKCSNGEYFEAVQILIDEGLRNRQKDGVVYDLEGNVICFDPDRVDPESMELLDNNS